MGGSSRGDHIGVHLSLGAPQEFSRRVLQPQNERTVEG